MLKMLENEKHRPDLVMLTGRWSLYTDNHHGTRGGSFLVDRTDQSLDYENSRRVLQTSIERTVKSINDLGIAVMLVGQSPEFEPNPNECYVKYRLLFADVTRCVRKPRQAVDAILGASNEILARAASLADKTKFVRVDDLFCDKQYCWAVKEKVPLYSDDHHVSSQAARDIAAYAATSKELGHIFKASRGEMGLSDPQPLRLQ